MSKTAISDINIDSANQQLARLSPLERIKWAANRFADNIILPSKFGPTSPIVLKLATTVMPEILVATIRHGHETPETTRLMKWYRDNLDLNLYVHDAPRLEIPDEDTYEFEQFQRDIKIDPFKQILEKFRPAAYFSGAMKWQTNERSKFQFIEDRGSVLAINPVLDISKENVDKFFLATGLPRNNNYYDPAKGSDQKRECRLNLATYNY